MNYKDFILGASLLMIGFQSVYAAECQPNGLGGYSCVNDDGSTSDSMPNEIGGTDTISSKGGMTSTDPVDSDDNAEVEGSSVNTPHDLNPAKSGKPQKPDAALMGRDWNHPSNINDGSATSSMSIMDQPNQP